MEIIGYIFLGVIIFIVLGLSGWGLKLLGAIFSFLTDGLWTCLGVIIIVFIALLLLSEIIAVR